MPSKHQRTIVIPPDVWAEIEKRTTPGYGGQSAAIATMLRRYVALLAESRQQHRTTLSMCRAMLTLIRSVHEHAPLIPWTASPS